MLIRRSPVVPRPLAALLAFETSTEGVCSLRPECRLLGDPALGRPKPVRPNGQPVLPAANLAMQETSSLEHGNVARDSGEGHRQRRGEIADPGVARSKCHEQCATGRIGQGGIGPVERLIFNHRVDNTMTSCRY